MELFERDLAIDLGTVSTRIFVQGKGIRLHEATVVAVDRRNGRAIRIGEDAKKMLGRTPANIAAIHPIAAGVISDYDLTSRMLREFIARVTSFSFFKPRVLILVPGSVTGVEERAIIDAVIEGGARKVYLLESTVATAYGAGVDAKKANGHMVVDIGGGTTEISVISLDGVAAGASVKTAGASFDEAIVKYIRKKHSLAIGAQTAEELKCRVGGVVERPEVLYEEVRGRCLLTGLPRSVTVSSSELAEAMEEPSALLLEAIRGVLEQTAPELVTDISENGILMAGGGSLLYGLDQLVSEKTGIDAVVVDDPLNCNIYGAGLVLRDLDDMSDGMINLARRKQMKA